LSLVVIFVPVSFMSSISGRFLYQFGITAAAAVLVSLLVSFTLTPMMSARLLRAIQRDESEAGKSSTAASGPEGAPALAAAAPADSAVKPVVAPKSRRGFYGKIDRTYAWLLGWALRHRWLVAGLALLVIAGSVPLYKLVRQEYVPSNVDEGEFDVYVTAPEGTSLEAMNPVARRVEEELRTLSAIRLVLASTGGSSFLGSVNNARYYVRLVPHAQRVFSWHRLLHWPPWRAFQGNYSARDVIMEVRRRLKTFSDLRVAVRNPQTFSLGGPNYDIDFALLGPDLGSLAAYAEQLRQKAPQLGLLDADTTH